MRCSLLTSDLNRFKNRTLADTVCGKGGGGGRNGGEKGGGKGGGREGGRIAESHHCTIHVPHPNSIFALSRRFTLEKKITLQTCLKNPGQSVAIWSQRGWQRLYTRGLSSGKHGGKCSPQNNFLIFSRHLGYWSNNFRTAPGNSVSVSFALYSFLKNHEYNFFCIETEIKVWSKAPMFLHAGKINSWQPRSSGPEKRKTVELRSSLQQASG